MRPSQWVCYLATHLLYLRWPRSTIQLWLWMGASVDHLVRWFQRIHGVAIESPLRGTLCVFFFFFEISESN